MNLFSFSFLSTNYESYGTRPFWDVDSLKVEINSFISGLLIRSLCVLHKFSFQAVVFDH